jgi:adenylate kinase
VFDGFPRNINQAISLDRFLSSRGGKVDLVLYFDTPLSLVASRLSQRRICPKCGALYNLESAQPSLQNICDDCGSTLVKREDDNEEIIKSRFQVYEEETAPVKDFYRKKDLLINIDGTNKKEEIWNEVKRYIEEGFHRENYN